MTSTELRAKKLPKSIFLPPPMDFATSVSAWIRLLQSLRVQKWRLFATAKALQLTWMPMVSSARSAFSAIGDVMCITATASANSSTILFCFLSFSSLSTPLSSLTVRYMHLSWHAAAASRSIFSNKISFIKWQQFRFRCIPDSAFCNFQQAMAPAAISAVPSLPSSFVSTIMLPIWPNKVLFDYTEIVMLRTYILDLDNMDIKFGNQVPKKSANKAVGTFSTTNASLIFVTMLSRIWIFGSGNSANQTVGKNKPITHLGPKSVGRILVFQKIIPADPDFTLF